MNQAKKLPIRHGLILSASRISDQITAAQKTEAAGFHSVWATEFFHQHGLVRMASVAAATQRVQVGSVALLRTPMLAASGAMNIDEISNGRYILYHSILDVSGWREIGETIAMKAERTMENLLAITECLKA